MITPTVALPGIPVIPPKRRNAEDPSTSLRFAQDDAGGCLTVGFGVVFGCVFFAGI